MSALLRLSATVPRANTIRWWQTGKTARLDCRTFTMAVGHTTLPYSPQFGPLDLQLGEFRMLAATPAQLALLDLGKTYGLHALLLNAVGEPVDDLRLTIEAV